MKRVAVIAIFMAVIASLFAFPVFGTTYQPETYNSFTDSITYNDLTYYVKVTQLKATSEGTSMLPGGMETIMLVQLQMTNNSTSDIKAGTIPKLTIDLRDSGSVITNVYSYGGDFTLGLMTGGICIFYPSADFSLDSNKVVVPPGKSLYFVGAIGLPATLDQTGSSTLDNGLRGVHLYDKANYQVTNGSYDYGTPIDMSDVIESIDNLASVVSTSSELQDLISLITYSGSNSTNISLTSNSLREATYTSNNVTITVRQFIMPEYVISRDYELNSTNDTLMSYQTYCVPIYVVVIVRNNNSYSVKCNDSVITINNVFDNYAELSNVYSGLFEYTDISTNYISPIYLRFKNLSNDGLGIIGPGLHTSLFVYHRYSSTSGSYTFNVSSSMNVASRTFSKYSDEYYYDSDNMLLNLININLENIYNAYSQVNGLDNIDNVTDDISSKSESAHTQEQSYFTQNAQAIEQTGLSNYRFNGDQENGIGSVSHDFTLLWNALGGFNSVYIFSLTLSLALMVLRHAPGAIRSSRRNKEE